MRRSVSSSIKQHRCMSSVILKPRNMIQIGTAQSNPELKWDLFGASDHGLRSALADSPPLGSRWLISYNLRACSTQKSWRLFTNDDFFVTRFRLLALERACVRVSRSCLAVCGKMTRKDFFLFYPCTVACEYMKDFSAPNVKVTQWLLLRWLRSIKVKLFWKITVCWGWKPTSANGMERMFTGLTGDRGHV